MAKKEKKETDNKGRTHVAGAEVEKEDIQKKPDNEGSNEEQAVSTKGDTADEQKEQRDPVEVLEEELKEQKDKYLRLMAEFDNYKRRTSKEYERLVELANERLMLNIIEVRESFERALSMADQNHDFSKFLEGMKLIFDKLDDILSKNGLSVFTQIGDEFSPKFHDAIMKTPHEEVSEDHIVEIYEKGYKLKERVIKHAKVIVSAGKSVETENTGKNEEPKEKVVE